MWAVKVEMRGWGSETQGWKGWGLGEGKRRVRGQCPGSGSIPEVGDLGEKTVGVDGELD